MEPVTSDSTSLEGLPDELLIEKIQGGNEEALRILHDRRRDLLRGLIRKILGNESEAEDVLQDVLKDVWQRARSYSPAKGDAFTWLVTLTKNRTIDRMRRRASDSRLEEKLQEESRQNGLPENAHSVEKEIHRIDLVQALLDTMEELPEAQSEAIRLAYFEGLTYREIAKATDSPLGTVRTRLELGLKKMADALQGWENELRES